MHRPLLVGGPDERTRRPEPPDTVDDVVDPEVTKLQQWARGDLNSRRTGVGWCRLVSRRPVTCGFAISAVQRVPPNITLLRRVRDQRVTTGQLLWDGLLP